MTAGVGLPGTFLWTKSTNEKIDKLKVRKFRCSTLCLVPDKLNGRQIVSFFRTLSSLLALAFLDGHPKTFFCLIVKSDTRNKRTSKKLGPGKYRVEI